MSPRISKGPRRRHRTTYAWGDEKPNIMIVVALIGVGMGLVYFMIFPPDFAWRPAPKIPLAATTNAAPQVVPPAPSTTALPGTSAAQSALPMVPPLQSPTAPGAPAIQPIPAPSAVAPPAVPAPQLGQPYRAPNLQPQTNQPSL